MKRLALGALVGCALCGALFASEEETLPPRKVSLTADGGKAFGEVSATLEAAGAGQGYRIKAIALTVGGKRYDVPQEQLNDLRNPLINTAEFRWEAGQEGDSPYLYLTFRLAEPGAKSAANHPRVYIRFRDGKLLGRSVHHPQADDT
jgi:hypothetical protein